MKSNFLQRAITGVLFVVVLVGCILYSPLSFGILFTIIGALSVHEFAHLIKMCIRDSAMAYYRYAGWYRQFHDFR